VWFISGTMDRCETADMPDEVTVERNGETITLTDDTERYNAWCEDGYLYIQTELCDNTLNDVSFNILKRNKILPPMGSEGEQELIKMMRNILSGLKYLHQRSLVHLDLKPSNLFVRRGVYKIGDLGHITQQKKHRRGSSSSLNTTPSEGDCCYMAKELLNFDPRNPLDLRKCDIFSLGASMYEIIRGVRLPERGEEWHSLRAGQLDFKFDTTSEQMTSSSSTTAKATTIVCRPVPISFEMESMLRKMMAVDPDARPTARKLLRDPLLQTESEQRLARAEALLRSHEMRQRKVEAEQGEQMRGGAGNQGIVGNGASTKLHNVGSIQHQPRLKRAVTM
jgi:serine/threonine protein kinase